MMISKKMFFYKMNQYWHMTCQPHIEVVAQEKSNNIHTEAFASVLVTALHSA